MAPLDPWYQWLIETRFGGDADAEAAGLRWLAGVRDTILDHADVTAGEVLLDVGAGDGLVAFGAIERVGTRGQVIVSDTSPALLAHARARAAQLGVHHRCRSVQAAAETLQPIADQSVDVVTTRSVLTNLVDKAAALRAFYRVLTPAGRISLFEPINRCMGDQPATRFQWRGYEVTPVLDLATRLQEHAQRLRPAPDPYAFDERDLLTLCEAARFKEIHLALSIAFGSPSPMTWELWITTPSNPFVPCLRELMVHLFTADEAARFEAHMRPLVETGVGRQRSALAYMWATQHARAG